VRSLGILILAVLLVGSCNERQEISVRRIVQPDYPADARYKNIQGTVQVEVLIGADGTVMSLSAQGGSQILQEAAKNNARQWQFGPFPPIGEFPIDHTITYVYSLTGKPLFVEHPPVVRTFLPDRVEIIATPLVSDNLPVGALKPPQPAKP
jgi:TonB family protein